MFNVKKEIKTHLYKPDELYLSTGLGFASNCIAYNRTSRAVNRELRWPVSVAVKGQMVKVFRC